MENGAPNYVLPRSFASLWMTKGNENKNSVELRVLCGEKSKKKIRIICVICVPSINQKSSIKNPIMKKEIWQKILQFVITVLTALATSIGVTSCGV